MSSWNIVRYFDEELRRLPIDKANRALYVSKVCVDTPVSIELLFDMPREPVLMGDIAFGQGWPFWLKKEWFKRGYGEGKRGPMVRLP